MFCVYASEEPNSFKAMFTSTFYMIEVGSGDSQVQWVSAKGKSEDYPCNLNQHHGKAKSPLGNNSGDDFLTQLHLQCTFSMKPVAQTSPRLFWVGNEIMLKYNINNLGVCGSLNWDWDSQERWNQNWNIFLATRSPDSTSAIEKQRAAQTYTLFFQWKSSPCGKKTVWPWTKSKEKGSIPIPLPAASQEPWKKHGEWSFGMFAIGREFPGVETVSHAHQAQQPTSVWGAMRISWRSSPVSPSSPLCPGLLQAALCHPPASGWASSTGSRGVECPPGWWWVDGVPTETV